MSFVVVLIRQENSGAEGDDPVMSQAPEKGNMEDDRVDLSDNIHRSRKSGHWRSLIPMDRKVGW